MTIKKDRQIERLERVLAAEREYAAKMFQGYREMLGQYVDMKMRLEAIERALKGEQ